VSTPAREALISFAGPLKVLYRRVTGDKDRARKIVWNASAKERSRAFRARQLRALIFRSKRSFSTSCAYGVNYVNVAT
jgi:hypothetical protein